MREFGWLTLVIGIAYVIYAFNMDVSVSVSSTYIEGYGSIGGGEVANLDLIARRQNHLIFASLITLIGVLMVLFSYFRAAPSAPAVAAPEPSARADFEGERKLSNDAYRLWLADTYAIARNDVFDRFVMGDATFGSLDDVLAKADETERERLAAIEAAEAERARIAEEERLERLAYLEAQQEEWERQKPWVIGGGILVAIAVIGGFYWLYQNEQERKAQEQAALEIAITELPEKWNVALPRESIREIREASQYETYLCNEKSDGYVVRLKPETERTIVLEALDESLGKRTTDYDLDDSGSWSWSKDGVRADLNQIGGDFDLCLTKTS